jgi:hypothetical protein
MKKQPPLDVDALVAELGEGGAPSAEALASASQLIATWFQWRAPGAGAAARRTLLHVAAAHGSLPALKSLLALGADPNATGDDGATPLHCACHARGDSLSEVLAVLLQAGADKEQRDSLGRRPLDLLLAQVRAFSTGQGRAGSSAEAGVPQGAHPWRFFSGPQISLALARRPPPAQLQTRAGDLDKPEYRSDEFRMYGFKVGAIHQRRARGGHVRVVAQYCANSTPSRSCCCCSFTSHRCRSRHRLPTSPPPTHASSSPTDPAV